MAKLKATMTANHQGRPEYKVTRDLKQEEKESCRSQAVPIKQPSNHRLRRRREEDAVHQQQVLAAQVHYDNATWDLYHRIVDHRRKYPVSSDRVED